MEKQSTILITVFLLAGIFSVNQSYSQSYTQITAGPKILLPTGDFSDGANTGFGGAIAYEHALSNNFSLNGEASYSFFGTDGDDNVGLFNFKAGGKYYFENVGKEFYLLAELGYYSMTIGDWDYSDISYGPGVGYALENINIQMSYQSLNTEDDAITFLELAVMFKF